MRVGDRVIQQINDYQREDFNGEICTVTSIGLEEQEMIVQLAERALTYEYADLAGIALRWAVTLHKNQSSEYPVIVLPLFVQRYLLLSRNLVYTGQTAGDPDRANQSHWFVHQTRNESKTLHWSC